MTDFEPTGSPGIDALLRSAVQLAVDPQLKESLEFARQVDELQAFRRSLEKQLRESLNSLPNLPLIQRLKPLIGQEFERFRGGGRRLEQYLAKANLQDLEVGCQRIHTAVTELQRLGAELRAQEEAWKEEFGPGLAGELKFLLVQAIRGHLPQVQASRALEKTLDSCREMQQNWLQVTPENDMVEEALTDCRGRLGDFIRTLQHTIASLQQQKSWELEERLNDLLEASAALSAAHSRLNQALCPPVICPQCGQSQPGDRPQCSQCSARLPLAPRVAPPAPPEPEARLRFQAFVEVEGRVGGWLRQETDLESCRVVIEAFLKRLNQGRHQMQQDRELLAEMKERLLKASQATQEALTELLRTMLSGERASCSQALERFLATEELMIQAQERAQELSQQP